MTPPPDDVAEEADVPSTEHGLSQSGRRWRALSRDVASRSGLTSVDPQLAAIAEQIRRARADTVAQERTTGADLTWHSRKTKRMDALRVGRDRNGHGWASWQIPLSFLLQLMSATWSLSASLDSFSGQRSCAGVAGQLRIDCATFTFEELFEEQNRTSVLSEHDGAEGVGSATHPRTINVGFVVLSIISVLGLLLIVHSASAHAELKHKTEDLAADNRASLRKFVLVFLVQLASFAGYWVLGARAPTAFPLLLLLHQQQDARNSNFDPPTAAAYAHAAQWTSALAASLMIYPLMGQHRRLYGCEKRRKRHIDALNREKSKTSMGTQEHETELFPVEKSTISRRQHQIMLFGAAWLYILAGAFFYWFTANEEFTTVAQAVYFMCVTTTTIGYGDMSPSTTVGRVVLIFYSCVGFGLMGAMLRQLGELLLTASEAPAYWLMRVVVMRLNPSYFPGFSTQIWRDHGVNTDLIADNITGNTKRKLWVGNIPSSLASKQTLEETFSKVGTVEKVTVPDIEQDKMDPESRWALVTMAKPESVHGSKQKKGKQKTGVDFVSMAAQLPNDPVIGHDGVLLVLPAQPILVCRHMLDSGTVSLSRLQVGMAVCLWLTFLLGIGPFYAMQTHAWTWGESVYFTFITMSTIGYGDYYPNDSGAKYSGSAHPQHHQVFVWCMGIVLIVFALSSFSFVYATVQDNILEQRDLQEQTALARERADVLSAVEAIHENRKGGTPTMVGRPTGVDESEGSGSVLTLSI